MSDENKEFPDDEMNSENIFSPDSDSDDVVEEFVYDEKDSSAGDDSGEMEMPDIFSGNAGNNKTDDDTEEVENPFENYKTEEEFSESVLNNKREYNPEPKIPVENISSSDEDDDAGVMETPDLISSEKGENAESFESSGSEAEQSFTPPQSEKSDVLSFAEHQKMSASDAENDRPKAKPKKINKRFLLTAIVTVFCLVFVVAFILPGGKAKSKKDEKPVAEEYKMPNYAAFANPNQEDEQAESTDEPPVEEHYKEPEKKKTEIPPVIPKEPYKQPPVSYSNGSQSTSTIPDTRNDRLQGKAISGIKGLTPTQANYSTDYFQTKEKNTSASAAKTNSFQMPTKEEYMNNVLSAYSQAYGNENSYVSQNDQKGKNAFFNSGNKNNAGQGEWLNLNTVWQGTIFEATLTSAINTDLPGEVTARVAKNIYSSQDARYLLIPQNSLLYGTYNSSISYAQSRVQVQWNTLIRPDGYKIELGGMNGTDAQGASGIEGHINDHPLAYLKAVALMSTVSIANAEFTAAMGGTQNEYVQNVLANTQQVANELGNKLIDRAMNVQPTIKIKEGTKINIVVNNTLTLPPCSQIPVTQAYHKY